MKTAFLVTALLLILVANVIMVYYAPNGLSPMEGFQNVAVNAGMANAGNGNAGNANAGNANNTNQVEGFNSYFLENAGGAKEKYSPVGAFDGVKLSTGNSVSGWRYTAPNESLTGAEFQPGADNLFMFKNNQCKPECCGASFSCGGGCVCTTPKQRQYIAGRGGNSTMPEEI
jgi:hypothetical protein